MFNFFTSKPKRVPLLNQEDIVKLREIERKAYIKEAENLALDKGKLDAKKDYTRKQEQTIW